MRALTLGRRKRRRSETRLKCYASEVPMVRISLTPALDLTRRKGARLLSGLLLLCLLGGIYFIFTSDIFYVYGATVTGTQLLSPGQIYAISGLDGISVFWINPEHIARLVESLPEVRQARVETVLPNQVVIIIEERRPVALWQSGDTRLWVSADGVLLPAHGDLPNAFLIVDADGQAVRPGDHIEAGFLTAALGLRELMPERAVIQFTRAWGISFQSSEGWRVYLGSGDDMAAKLAVLRALRQDILSRGEHLQFVDLRFPDRPYYR
jgi:cell division protein FtsQ